MPGSKVTITAKGPLFDNPDQVMEDMANAIIQDTLKIGEQRLARAFRPRPGGVFLSVAEAGKGQASTGHYRRSLHVVQTNLAGQIDDSGVVYGPWLEGGRGGTRFRGYGMFRKTTTFLNKQIPKISRLHLNRTVARLNS